MKLSIELVCSVSLVDKASDYGYMGPSSMPRTVVTKVNFRKHEAGGCKKLLHPNAAKLKY